MRRRARPASTGRCRRTSPGPRPTSARRLRRAPRHRRHRARRGTARRDPDVPVRPQAGSPSGDGRRGPGGGAGIASVVTGHDGHPKRHYQRGRGQSGGPWTLLPRGAASLEDQQVLRSAARLGLSPRADQRVVFGKRQAVLVAPRRWSRRSSDPLGAPGLESVRDPRSGGPRLPAAGVRTIRCRLPRSMARPPGRVQSVDVPVSTRSDLHLALEEVGELRSHDQP